MSFARATVPQAAQDLISSGNDWAFAPSVTLASGGGLVAAWWNWHNTPDGCTVGVDCTGTTNWLLARSSADGIAWTAPTETRGGGRLGV